MLYWKKYINKRRGAIKYSYHNPKFSSGFKSIMWDNFIGTTSSIMVLKKTILEVNMFDEKMPALQDYDLYIRICKSYKVGGLDKALVNYSYNHSKNQISMKKAGGNWKKSLHLMPHIYHYCIEKLKIKRVRSSPENN